MKILVVGAGALGGYYGGRLLEAGCDVTFLLRPKRIAQLEKTNGLQVKSSYGDMSFPNVKYITSEQIDQPFDLIIVSCKAYSLQGSIDSFAPAVGSNTMILPVLNGMQHIDILIQRFGKDHVLGGLALISATLDAAGQVLHLNKVHGFTFGELNGQDTPRIQAVKKAFEHTKFDSKYSDNIMQAMWNKWIMIATAVGTTCLFRGGICDVVKAGGSNYITALLDECIGIAAHNKFKPDEATCAGLHKNLTDPKNELMASMLKDIEKGYEIEATAIIENLINHAPAAQQSKLPMLNLVHTHLKTYLARKERGAL